MGSKSSPVIGFRYYLGFVLSFCLSGIVSVRKIATDKKLLWEGDVSANETITIDKPDLFGGDPPDGTGGMQGDVDIQFGASDQGVNTYIQNKIRGSGDLIPAYRQLFTMVFKSFYFGNQPSLKPIKALLVADGEMESWNDSLKWITRDDVEIPELNPAHIIRHFIISSRDGMAMSASTINDASFSAAAQTLYDESMAMSIKLTRSKSFGDLFDDIKRHINAEIFQNVRSGMWEIVLIRNDYEVEDLISLDKSNTVLQDFKKTSSNGACNDMTITYIDLKNDREVSVNQKDLALIDKNNGQTVSISNDYLFFSSESLAREICARDLRQASIGLSTLKLDCHQEDTENLKKGSVFKYSNSDIEASDTVYRVTNIDFGSPDKPKVTIDAIEDIYSFGYSTDSGNTGNNWTPIITDPEVLATREILPMPYPLAQRTFGSLVDNDSKAVVMCLASPQTATDRSFTCNYDINDAGYTKKSNGFFSPWAIADNALGLTGTTISYTASTRLDEVELPAMGLIGGELVNITASDTVANTLTIVRGCGETIPVDHAATVRLWVITPNHGLYGDLIDGDDVDVKLQAINGNGSLHLDDIPADNILMTDYLQAPFMQANIQINGENWPTSLSGELTFTWNTRDAVAQEDDLIGYYTASDIATTGHIHIRITDQSGSEILSNNEPSNNKTYSFTPGTGVTSITVTIKSVVDGVDSVKSYVRTITWAEI